MMFPIDYNGDVLNHNARVGVDGGIVESTDFLADFSEQTKRVNMPLLLDIYPNAAAAYSLRKLRTAYTGSAIRVRRSSDNTETDIGFNNAGDLDTSALMAFVGNGNGFVSTWYDQSGTNNPATQTGTTEQPVIVSGGTLITNNNKPAIQWVGSGSRMSASSAVLASGTSLSAFYTYSTDLAAAPNTNTLICWFLGDIFTSNNILGISSQSGALTGEYTVIDVRRSSNGLERLGSSTYRRNSNATITENVFFLTGGTTLYQNRNLQSLDLTAAGASTTTNYTPSSGTITGNLWLGSFFASPSTYTSAQAKFSEFIFYTSNQSPNRIGIETNINSYYRIYQQEALLLDYYPDAAAAYSLRKLRSGYTGAAIQVRRSSDSAVQNIGFDSNGGLDTTALTTFVGTGNTGFVTTWYDQSGNNRNATQATQANQPVIVSGGTIISENNKPILRFDNTNSNFLNIPNNFTGNYANLSAVAKITNSSATNELAGPIIGSVGSANQFAIYYRTTGNEEFGITTRLAFSNVSGIVLTKLHTYTINTGDGIFKASLNNINIIDSTGTTIGFRTTGNPRIGSNVGGSLTNYLGGFIQEVIVWTTNQFNNQTNISNNINSYYNIYPTDSDANAFVTAAGLTGTTQIQAVNKLVTDLKGYGLWGKMKAIYPFVGGTAASHKFNLKDPRDVDGAFRLVFNGGWTHSATGAKPDGSTGYANTYFTPSSVLTVDSTHMSIYSNTNDAVLAGSTDPVDMGSYNSATQSITLVNSVLTVVTRNLGAIINWIQSTRLGLVVTNKTASNITKIHKNGVVVASGSSVGTLPTLPIFIGTLNFLGTPYNIGYTNNRFAFVTIGDGLTDTEAANLYTAVQTFQTTLGRQV